jgi:hypothetical protein
MVGCADLHLSIAGQGVLVVDVVLLDHGARECRLELVDGGFHTRGDADHAAGRADEELHLELDPVQVSLLSRRGPAHGEAFTLERRRESTGEEREQKRFELRESMS